MKIQVLTKLYDTENDLIKKRRLAFEDLKNIIPKYIFYLFKLISLNKTHKQWMEKRMKKKKKIILV